jgi:hypothetical protein
MRQITISQELAHLIKASIPAAAEAGFNVEPGPVNPSKFLALAKWHQVRPLALDYAQENLLELPENALQTLRQFSLGQAVTNMAFVGISARLYNQLIENGVRAFPMKGALWAWMLYEKPASREFGDIDYFIGKEDVAKSLDILFENGFAPDDYRQYLLHEKSVAADYLNTDYQLPLSPVREHTLQSLEIQWNCTYPRYCYNFTWNELANGCEEFDMKGNVVLVPKVENQLIMMVIHHGGVEQWDKLKYAADFVRLLKKYAGSLDWDYIRQVSTKKGFNRLLSESLGVAGMLTGENYSKYFSESQAYPSDGFVKEIMAYWESERPSLKTKTWRILLYNLKYRDRWTDKLSIVAAHLNYFAHWRLLWYKLVWYRRGPSGEIDRNRTADAMSGREDI